jgi:membrane associated rhomboid family serine protease
MFPLRDENPSQSTPIATFVLIGLNVLAWALLQGFGSDPALSNSICNFGLIPADLGSVSQSFNEPRMCPPDMDAGWFNILSSMFMHGGWMHIIGNMWFLWIFGDNVEDAMGSARFVIFYLLSGLGAALAQMWSDPASAIPMVGASGAIGGVMGAYALLYPRAHVHMLIFLGFYITTVAVPAVFMLGYWFLLQIFGSFAASTGGGGVAFWAHIGGFLAGCALVYLFRQPERVQKHISSEPRRTAKHRWF